MNFNYQLREVKNASPVSELDREVWIKRCIESLLEENKFEPNGGYVDTFCKSGDSFVWVSISRDTDGILKVSVEDCLRRRSVFLHKLEGGENEVV